MEGGVRKALRCIQRGECGGSGGWGWGAGGVHHETGFSGQTSHPAQGEACSRAALPPLSGARTAGGKENRLK